MKILKYGERDPLQKFIVEIGAGPLPPLLNVRYTLHLLLAGTGEPGEESV